MGDRPSDDDRELMEEQPLQAGIVDATVSTDYKILGEAELPGGTGVLGHNTASSGVSFGVEGVTDSADSGATGVKGTASATSGLTFGLHGISESTDGIGVFAEAPNGSSARALFARADGPGAEGILAKATAESGGPIGIEGHTQGRGAGAAGVAGLTLGSPSDAVGVYGHHQATTGSGTGVEGITDSSGSSATGVSGRATQGAGHTFGVYGSTNSDGGPFINPAGVRGNAPSGSGSSANGVYGTTAGTGYYDSLFEFPVYASGVKGRATASSGVAYNAGLHGINDATSGQGYGVLGHTNSINENAAGVRGVAQSGSSFGTGVEGITDGVGFTSTEQAIPTEGVLGRATATTGVTYNVGVRGVNHSLSGTGYGVLGQTFSANEDAAAVVGAAVEPAAGVLSNGRLEVLGHVDVTDVGVSAYLSGNQSIPDDFAMHTIEFDEVRNDDFGGMDTATGVYTIPVDGDYHVSVNLEWADSFSSDNIDYRVHDAVSGRGHIWSRATEDGRAVRNFSKTIFGLNAGNSIEAEVRQLSGSPKDISGGVRYDTYMTIHKVG